MAEIILPPEENEETPQVPELNIDKPTENSKVITIEFEAKKTNKVSTKDTNQQLYTTDTDAWFEFKETSLEGANGTYSVVFRNRHDGSIFQRTGDVVDGVAYYKIPHQEIRHAGAWRGQVVYTLENGNTTAREFDYVVKGHILDGKDVREIVVEDFETLMSQLNSMKDNAELELADLVNTAERNELERQQFYESLVEDINDLQENYQELLDTGVLQTNINEKLEELEEEYAPKLTEVTAQLAQKATQTDFDANDYGADPSASWTVNRDAFQAANDAAAANGGGRVVAKAGLYEVKGIVQDSHVEFYLPGVTFKNPDGESPNVIEARRHEVIGTVSGNTLAVDDVSNFEKGSSIIVHHAGGILDTQFSSLPSNINGTTTTISLSDTDNRFPASGYMQVGSELIGYTSISGTALNGVTRGALGTTPQNHNAGDYIGVARHFYTEVTEIDGNNLVLAESPPLNVSNTTVLVGAIKPSIKHLTIDGNKIPTGYSGSVYGIGWSTVRWGNIQNIRIKNGDMGGLILSKGTTESVVDDIILEDCGVWESSTPKGSGMWIFQGSRRNSVNNITVTGKGWTALYIDDRTTVASPYDAPCNDNYITNFVFDKIRPAVGYPPAFVIVGSNRNKFINGYVKGTATGVEIDHGGQYFTDDGSLANARDNEVAGVHFDVGQPWILRSTGNRIHDCTYSSRATSVPIVTEGNLAYAVTTTAGEPIDKLFGNLRFDNGTASNPSISFVNQPSTGFYNDGTATMRLAIDGSLKYSFYGSELRLQPGVDIATGSDVGTKIPRFANQKLGFFGKTPISQPPAISNKTGQTLEQVEFELNLVKTTLRNLGLIAT